MTGAFINSVLCVLNVFCYLRRPNPFNGAVAVLCFLEALACLAMHISSH